MRTDHGTWTRIRKLRAEVAQVIFGPWQIRPVLIGFISFAILQYASGVLAIAQSQAFIESASQIPLNLVRATGISGALLILLRLHGKVTGRRELTRTGYLLIIFIAGCGAAFVRFVTIPDSVDQDLGLFVVVLVRAMLTLMTLMSALGIADSRLLQQIRQTDAALTIVRTQRSAVLEAEERARQSIATLLHDRVQAGLVAATLQLKQLANSLKGEEGARLESVIADLEAIRTKDVRSASRQLSPDLRNITLTQSLKVLASTYEPAMGTSIDVDALEEAARLRDPQSPLRLGAYRIVEQALLNAAVHGGATAVSVTAERLGDDLLLTISDNGRGIGSDPIDPGTGSTIIDAWAAAMNGTWAIEGNAVGTRVTVRVHEHG